MKTPTSIETYIQRLERALAGIESTQRAIIVGEVASHLTEVAERDGDEGVARAMAGFGDPVAYAEAMIEAAGLERALASSSFGTLASTAIVYAGRSLLMTLTAIVGGFFGLFAIAFAAVAVAKIVIPAQTGLFIGPDDFFFGFVPAESTLDADERLGWFIIPVSIVLAVLAATISVQLSRWGMRLRLRRLGPRQQR